MGRKVIVFGASGATGSKLTEQALAQGDQVVAFVRTPAKITLRHEGLQVIQGDVLDSAAIQGAMGGCDAALSTLGHDTLQNVTIYSQSATAILAAMQACGVRRLVFLTSANAPDGLARNAFTEELRSGALHDTYADMRKAEALIMGSDVDWTIVRPGGLTDDPYTGQYQVELDHPPANAYRIARADVADFMLKCLADAQYVHTVPFIGGGVSQDGKPSFAFRKER